jgi:uncharacterized membrane protein
MLSRTKRTVWWILATAVIGLLCSAQGLAKKPPKPEDPPVVAPRSYEIVRLDDGVGGWSDCRAEDINAAGDVVGYLEDPDLGRIAACWDVTEASGEVTCELVLLSGGSGALGVNDLGQIVGYRSNAESPSDAVYWASMDTAPITLPALDEEWHSTALEINNAGLICGNTGGQAAVWRVNWIDGALSVWGPLPMPALGGKSWAIAINNCDENDSATVVGQSMLADNSYNAAVAWSVQAQADGSVTVIGLPVVLAVDDPDDADVRVRGLNDTGAICGKAFWPPLGVVWTEDQTTALAVARDAPCANAYDINEAGVAVGWGGQGQGWCEAVAWHGIDGKMVMLSKYLPRKNAPFTMLIEATAINASGRIAGYGIDEEGRGAFLALPE